MLDAPTSGRDLGKECHMGGWGYLYKPVFTSRCTYTISVFIYLGNVSRMCGMAVLG